MNPRIKILWLIVWSDRVRLHAWRFVVVAPVLVVGRFMLAMATSIAKKRGHDNVEALKKAVAQFAERGDSFCSECEIFRTGRQITESRRQELLATQAALKVERERLQSTVKELRSPQNMLGVAAISAVLTSMQEGIFKRQRKRDALLRIISQVESPTFYWDLLVWLAVPGSYGEELLGDLAEEFQLQRASEGETRAHAWYRDQVFRTVCEHGWKKIERLAAIGTLVDFVIRLLR